jgi:phage terminase large subunit-like protein
VTVGVDPSGGADVVGIVVSALLTDGRFAILADRSVEGSPATWGDAVERAHDDYDADDVCVEINFGGAMCTDVVKSAAKRAHEKGARGTDLIRVKEVTASRGKVLRAEPVSLLWEQGKVLMRPGMEALELEMLQSREWDRAIHGSPNRLDAMVWSVTRLARVVTKIPIA